MDHSLLAFHDTHNGGVKGEDAVGINVRCGFFRFFQLK
jgi:hypothetical protein